MLLPSLDRGNCKTTSEFQILLTEHRRSGLREEQSVTCHMVQFLFLTLLCETGIEKISYKFVEIFILIFGLCLKTYISS